MKFALTVFAILSYLVAASLAADDKCKFANFQPNQTLKTGSKQVIEWQCKGEGKTDLIYIEFGKGKTPDDYEYVDTIDAKAKASAKKFSFILKDEYQTGDYVARMLTTGAKEELPVEEADRAQLPWTYSPTFKIENDSIDNSTSKDGKNTTDDNTNSPADNSDDNSSRNSNNRNSTNKGSGNALNAAGGISSFGSSALFCAGVLATLLVL